MENNVKYLEGSRINSVSEKGAIEDGILFGNRKELKKAVLKVPKTPVEKEKRKNANKGKPRKWYPNAEGKYECPFCGKSYKNVHSASCHVWADHKQGKKKGSKKQDETALSATFDSLSSPSTSLWDWLKIIPINFIESMDPDKLKDLILEKRKEDEKKPVAKPKS